MNPEARTAYRSGNSAPLYTQSLRRWCGLLVGIAAFAPAYLGFPLVFWLLHLFAPKGTGPVAATIVLGGAALIFGALFAAVFRATFWHMALLQRKVQPKLEADYGMALGHLPHVGFSPGAEAQDFGSETSWDIGFLDIHNGLMTYRGDLSAFSLRSEQVEKTEVRTHQNVSGQKFPRIYVTWHAEPKGILHFFNLEARDVRSVKEMHQKTNALCERIEAWRQEEASVTTLPDSLGLPVHEGEVQGKPLPPVPEMAKTGFAAKVLAFVVAMSANAAVLYMDIRVTGWKLFQHFLPRMGLLLITIILMNVLSVRFQRWMDARQTRALPEQEQKQ